jgi:hypothetical protein
LELGAEYHDRKFAITKAVPARHGASSNAAFGGGLFTFRIMSSKAKPLPMDIIREALEIDPTSKTGLRWKIRPRNHFKTKKDQNPWNARFSGKAAGTKVLDGRTFYFRVTIDYTMYPAHRIVYALAYLIDPGDKQIDHIDGNGENNAPDNLRLATNTENCRNRRKNSNNKSGEKGVSWSKRENKWQARIGINGRRNHIGYFDSVEAASAAYERVASNYFGEFYREGAAS